MSLLDFDHTALTETDLRLDEGSERITHALETDEGIITAALVVYSNSLNSHSPKSLHLRVQELINEWSQKTGKE